MRVTAVHPVSLNFNFVFINQVLTLISSSPKVTTFHLARQRNGNEVNTMTRATRLTVQTIETAKSRAKEYWLSDDDGGRGSGRLTLRVCPGGRKLFYFRYSVKGKRPLVPLGPYTRAPVQGYLTLEEARKLAYLYSTKYRNLRAANLPVALGHQAHHIETPIDPPADTTRSQDYSPKFTVMDVCNNYVQHLKNQKKQSAAATASYFRVHVEPTQWAALPASEFSPKQAAELLRKIIGAGHTTTAMHVRRALHAAYQLAMRAETDPSVTTSVLDMGIDKNPIAGTASLSQFVVARTRAALSNLELLIFR